MDKRHEPKTEPRKSTCTLFTPDLEEYNCNLELQINKTKLPMSTHPMILGVTFDPKLTQAYNTQIQITGSNAPTLLHIVKKALSTTWGKQKETLLATYKAVMRPVSSTPLPHSHL